MLPIFILRDPEVSVASRAVFILLCWGTGTILTAPAQVRTARAPLPKKQRTSDGLCCSPLGAGQEQTVLVTGVRSCCVFLLIHCHWVPSSEWVGGNCEVGRAALCPCGPSILLSAAVHPAAPSPFSTLHPTGGPSLGVFSLISRDSHYL